MTKSLKDEKFRLWLLWGFAVLLYFFANLQKVVIPGVTFNELQQHFSATAGSITGLGAVFMYTYAFSQLFVGLLVDRFSGARIMAWGGLLLVAGSILSAVAPSLWLLYAARILVGIGSASIYLSVTKETNRIFPGNFAVMLGFVMVFGYLGGVSGNAPFIAGVQAWGWQWALMLVGVISAVAYGGFIVTKGLTSVPAIQQSAKFDFRRFLDVLKRRHNIHVIICGAFTFGLYFVIQSIIGKKFLEDYSGMSAEGAGWVLTVLMIIGAVNSILAPWLSRLLGNRRRVFMLFSGLGTALALLLIVLALALDIHSPWIMGGCFILMAFAANISPVIVALIKETNFSDIWGVALSLYTFIAYMIIAALGNVVGLLMDIFEPESVDGLQIYGRESYLVSFGALLVISLFAVYSAFKVRETYGRDVSESV